MTSTLPCALERLSGFTPLAVAVIATFLVRSFTKLLMNFSWWVNRKGWRRFIPLQRGLSRYE